MASITVLSANHAPTDILLDNCTVKENLRGIVIGTLLVVDQDVGDTFAIQRPIFPVRSILPLHRSRCVASYWGHADFRPGQILMPCRAARVRRPFSK